MNGGWTLVESDTETFEFALDDCLITERFEHVEDDEDEVASTGDGDDWRR